MLRACTFGDLSTVQALLAQGDVDPARDNNAALRRASKGGHVAVVVALLADHRVHPGACDSSALREASKHGHANVVAVLLADARVRPDAWFNRAIIGACDRGHADVVALLLPRVDPRMGGVDLIHLATSGSHGGHANVLRLLLTDGRVPPSDDVFIRCCGHGYVRHVPLLLADGRVDPGADGSQALVRAALNGHVDVVALLLADARVDPLPLVNFEYAHATLRAMAARALAQRRGACADALAGQLAAVDLDR